MMSLLGPTCRIDVCKIIMMIVRQADHGTSPLQCKITSSASTIGILTIARSAFRQVLGV